VGDRAAAGGRREDQSEKPRPNKQERKECSRDNWNTLTNNVLAAVRALAKKDNSCPFTA
jgi:hypothetical protein